jgi:hypothetical protein
MIADLTIAAVGIFAITWWATRRSWDKTRILPLATSVVDLSAYAASKRHARIEFEVHAHRHWGWKRHRFTRGALTGWALHIGFGRACLCVDFYRRGRRP